MSKFGLGFIIDSKHLGEVLEVLQPYKVQDLDIRLVAGTSKKVRAGDKPAWEIVAEHADSTPRPFSYFKEKLLAAGFKTGTVYNALDSAVERKAIVKTAKGFKKGGKA